MVRTQVATLAFSAFAMTALTGAGAPAVAPPYNPSASPNPGQPVIDTNPWRVANESAMSAPQLFGFPSQSNKSVSLGAPDCIAGSAKNKSRPKVIATFPAEGAVVRPGVVVVRITFDQPMACDASFDGTSDLPNPCPGRWREVTISLDRRSFRTVCEVKADTRYRLVLRSFRNTHGLTIPAEVTFSTSGSAPIATIQQALAEDPGAGMVAGG
jgi:hypothetical protein